MFVFSCRKKPFRVEKELVSAEPPLVGTVDLGDLWESEAWVTSCANLLGDTQHLAARDLTRKWAVSAEV